MRVGLHDAEKEHFRRPKTFPNLALMKISAWHKGKGDTVEWWNPLFRYDRVYSSKVFDFTPENPYLPPDTIKGGTGYDIKSTLPDEVDEMYPDYSIYPECDYAIGFLTRGCIRTCPWCVVPEKEGYIQPYRNWRQVVRKDTKKLVLMDNNILASPWGIDQLEELSRTDYRIDINQGMDARLVIPRLVDLFRRLHWIKYIRFSCDVESQVPYIQAVYKLFKEKGISVNRIFVYFLVRQDLKEASRRLEKLKQLKGISIYAQAEMNPRKGILPIKAQKEFAQRYVYGRCYKAETWEEYCKRKGMEGFLE